MPKKKKSETKKKAADDSTFQREPGQFSLMTRSVIFGEPKAIFRATFLLIPLTTGVLLAWSFLSYVNVSFFLQGRVYSPDPSVAITIGEDFKIEDLPVAVGSQVHEKDVLAGYASTDGSIHQLRAPLSGLVVALTRLHRGLQYRAGTQVAEIRPESRNTGIELDVEPDGIAKLHPGQEVVFRFAGTPGTVEEIPHGTLVTAPVPAEDAKGFIAHAALAPSSLAALEAQGFRMIPGLPLSAEVIIGKQRLISRILGMQL